MAAKSGETVGKPPKTGVDRRPWIVVRDGITVVRCWYKDTADTWAKINGGKVGRAKVRR